MRKNVHCDSQRERKKASSVSRSASEIGLDDEGGVKLDKVRVK